MAKTQRMPVTTEAMDFSGSALARFGLVIVLSICSYFFFSRVVVTAVEVKGSSMYPTLLSGDRMLLNRFAYLHRMPERGELVVLRDPETHELIVKRIVGLPLETIRIDASSVFVNGRKLAEPYIGRASKTAVNEPSVETGVPKDYYYVLGDNRGNSSDSRVFGPVSRESILGLINL